MKSAILACVLAAVSLVVVLPGAAGQVSHRKSFLDQQNKNVKITNGPIVESLKSDSATIAWSTNAKSGSKVMYGPGQNRLKDSEEAPPDGKGLMHRVQLKNLQPDKTYYFRVQSQSTERDSRDRSKILSFRTPALGAQASRNEIPQP